MPKKTVLFCLFSILCLFAPFSQFALSSQQPHDHMVHSLASLLFYMRERERSCVASESEIQFSQEDIVNLWNKVGDGLSSHIPPHVFLFNQAYQYYEEASRHMQREEYADAQKFFHTSSRILDQLWNEVIELEENEWIEFFPSFVTRNKKDANFENNPYLSSMARKAIKPYLLPLNHPRRSFLDSIFLKTRATADEEAFYAAGFRIIAKRPRSYVCVATHLKMRGYLVKAYLDTELQEKFNKKSWEWLVRRCKGASKIRNVIRKYHLRHFVVPDKWIYCLPPEPSPPNDQQHTRHLALLLVRRMKLASKRRNYHAWFHEITEEHLDELFEIISRAKGASYRPDNVAYLKNRQFAFIDTEYPSKGPDFNSIREYLSPEMRNYWDFIVRNGGYKIKE